MEIITAIKLQGGTVKVFGAKGKLMPEYKCRSADAGGSIFRDPALGAIFVRRFNGYAKTAAILRRDGGHR